MATIQDWYQSHEIEKTASAQPGYALLKQAGIVKEAGWLGTLVGKLLSKSGKYGVKGAWAAGSHAPGRLIPRAMGGVAKGGKRVRALGKDIKAASKDTSSWEDLKRFRKSKYFWPTVGGAGLTGAGLGTGYMLKNRG